MKCKRNRRRRTCWLGRHGMVSCLFPCCQDVPRIARGSANTRASATTPHNFADKVLLTGSISEIGFKNEFVRAGNFICASLLLYCG